MQSPETSQGRPEHLFSPQGAVELRSRFESKIKPPRSLGVDQIDVFISNGSDFNTPLLDSGSETPSFGASIKKLFIAKYWLSQHSYDKDYPLTDSDVQVGGGLYDTKRGSHDVLGSDLLEDMLRRSGNTAARMLLGENVDNLNEYLSGNGYEHSFFVPKDVKGARRFEYGDTTPYEAARIMNELMADANPLSLYVKAALQDSTAGRGVRDRFRDLDRVTLFNKTGAYPSDEDIPYHTRHDVGQVLNAERVPTTYAIFTRSSHSFGAKIAEQKIGVIGAELIRALGGRPLSILGSLAIRAS